MTGFAGDFLAVVFLVCVWTADVEADTSEEDMPSEDLPVSVLLQRANFGLVHAADEPPLVDDIAMTFERPESEPCRSRKCMWPKSRNGKVQVPYYISNHFSSHERSIIRRALDSFTSSTCIHFKPHRNERDYIGIFSRNGCYSYVGRRGGQQIVSLDRKGCLHHGTIQHELLHALGFNHEQARSDRDKYIRVMWDNIIDGKKHNFNKMKTLNQDTAYDYNSVMQYNRFAFSKNRQPTMVPIPDEDIDFGEASEMTKKDINRVNKVYKCRDRKK